MQFEKGDDTMMTERSEREETFLLSKVQRVSLPALSVRQFALVTQQTGYETLPELMTEHELLIVLDGKLTSILAGDIYTAGVGECLYAAAGDIRCLLSSEGAVSYLCLSFWDARETAEFPFPHKIPYHIDAAASATVQYCRHICESSAPTQQKQCIAALGMLLVQLEDFTVRYNENEYVRTMKEYVFSHYREGVQLADLAAAVNLHPVYCAKLFKQHEGETVGAFINRLRLTRAVAQLESTEETSDVAADLGLSEYYFSRWFRQMTGLTPTDYRDALRKKYR